MDQLSFASLDFAAKKEADAKRDVFLTSMAAVVPWGALEALIEPHYPKVGPQGSAGGRSHYRPCCASIACSNGTTCLLGAEKDDDIQSMRMFAGLELGCDAIPDETTNFNFVICSSVTT